MSRRPPRLEALIEQTQGSRPVAFVLAGHNGSGKSTLWYSRLADSLRIPLLNADRMMMSILPETSPLPAWAQQLRDDDVRWQVLSQEGVRVFKRLVVDQRMPFPFETVFSHWKALPGGGHESKADDIRAMHREEKDAFTLVRAQKRRRILFDVRDPQFKVDPALRTVSDPGLERTVGPFKRPRKRRGTTSTSTT